MQKELFETRNTFLPTKQFSMYPTYLKASPFMPGKEQNGLRENSLMK
jgi:hypothetical protein